MTKLITSTLRPGLLVSLKTSVRGNVSYQKIDLDSEVVDEETKTATARWETTRTVVDAQEHKNAKKARSKAASLVRGVCRKSAFGLLCPEVDGEKLAKAIKEAHEVVDGFNEVATLSRVSVYVITGRVAPDDVEAIKAINSEVRDMMDLMANGMRNLDVKVIRDASARVKKIGGMLNPDSEARVRIAVELAREAAKAIVKAGETGAMEVDNAAIKKISEQRLAFLDLDGADTPIAKPKAKGKALDLPAQMEFDAAIQDGNVAKAAKVIKRAKRQLEA